MSRPLGQLARHRQAVRRMSWTLNQLLKAKISKGDKLLVSLSLKESKQILDGELDLYGEEIKNLRRVAKKRSKK